MVVSRPQEVSTDSEESLHDTVNLRVSHRPPARRLRRHYLTDVGPEAQV